VGLAEEPVDLVPVPGADGDGQLQAAALGDLWLDRHTRHPLKMRGGGGEVFLCLFYKLNISTICHKKYVCSKILLPPYISYRQHCSSSKREEEEGKNPLEPRMAPKS
jgi:hypothetical protein